MAYKTGEALQVGHLFKRVNLSLYQNMWSCKYIETSAKEGSNIHELFEDLLTMEQTMMLSLKPIEDTKKKKRKCCLQ